MTILEWIEERRDIALRISRKKTGDDRLGWLEDADYFNRTVDFIRQVEFTYPYAKDNGPLRMYIALKILRAWNSGSAGFCVETVKTVLDWWDDGMKGPIPFPSDYSFAEWAKENGFTNINGCLGFKFEAELCAPEHSKS